MIYVFGKIKLHIRSHALFNFFEIDVVGFEKLKFKVFADLYCVAVAGSLTGSLGPSILCFIIQYELSEKLNDYKSQLNI